MGRVRVEREIIWWRVRGERVVRESREGEGLKRVRRVRGEREWEDERESGEGEVNGRVL